jgi:AraC-like DNA-binding protein
VLSVSSRALLEACTRIGLDTGQILQAAKLDLATLQDPDARIPVEQVEALWKKAYELSNDPNLALHAVEALPFGAYRVIDFLASNAPTIGAALAKVADYFPLINAVVRVPYAVGECVVTYGIEAPARPSTITRPYAEYALGAIVLRTRVATGQPYALVRVEFSHPPPPDTSEHERIFECPVRFGAERCQLVIARTVWDTPRAGSDPALFSVLDTHARMLLDQLPSAADIAGRVREALAAELGGGDPSLESIAGRLAMSPRTLQRRLRDQGVVFNDLVDAMRFRAARSYLAQRDIAAAEVAYLLGFAEPSSFVRAFRRWSAETPTEYRRRIGAA